MIRFDYTLSRPKEYYMEKMKKLEAEYETRGKYIGKRYLKGIHFKPQGEKIFGHYCPGNGYHQRGLVIPFAGKFTCDQSGNLHFQGWTYPQILVSLLLLIIIALSVFVTKRAEMIIISSAALAINIICFFAQSRQLLRDLEIFFV